MNVKAFIPLIAGLCIGGFALKVGLDTLKKAKGAQTETAQIWAAKVDIPRGIAISAEMLSPVDFPQKLVPAGAFPNKDKLIGRVPRIEAPAGLPVLAGMLSPLGTPTGVSVPPGYRAVAVKIDEGSGVDYHLEPGSHVDVVGFFSIQSGGKRETVARTLMENVQVAAVGDRLSTAALNEEDAKSNRSSRAVTLLVRPDKVPVLHLAEQRGKIKLSMRNHEDEGEVGACEPISDGELINPFALAATEQEVQPAEAETSPQPSGMTGWLGGLFGPKASTDTPDEPVAKVVTPPVEPEPPADPPWTVQVYRGDKLEVVQFQSAASRERVTARTGEKGAAASPSAAARCGTTKTSATSATPEVEEELLSQDEELEEDPEPQEPTE